jgi:hypothetical protein
MVPGSLLNSHGWVRMPSYNRIPNQISSASARIEAPEAEAAEAEPLELSLLAVTGSCGCLSLPPVRENVGSPGRHPGDPSSQAPF